MTKPRSLLLDYLVYLAVRIGVCVLQMLSLQTSLRLAELLAWLAYRLDRRHRTVADDNLRHALPHLPDGERDRVVQAVYRHFLGVLLTMLHLPRCYNVFSWRRYL